MSLCPSCGAEGTREPYVTWLIAGVAWEERTCSRCGSTRSHRKAETGRRLDLAGPCGGSVVLPWSAVQDALGHLVDEGPDPWAWRATCPPGSELRDGGRVLAVVTRGGLWRCLSPEER